MLKGNIANQKIRIIKTTTYFLMIFFVLLVSVSFAYDTKNYSIDFPSSYHYASEGSYSSQEGYNLNVKVVPYTNTMYYEDIYNAEQVKTAKDNIYLTVDYMKVGVVDNVKQRYPGMYTDEQLQSIADTIKVGTIYETKIAKVSKNNYDSIMTLYSYYMLDIEYFVLTHSVSDKNNIYVITASGNTKDYFEKKEIKNAFNSFTIKNYAPLLHKNMNTSSETKNETNKASNLCENENYSIIMPESYSYSNEGSYSSKEGYNINVKAHKYSEHPEMADLESETIYYEDIYNNEMVDYYKQNITNTFYNAKNNVAEKQKQQYKGQVSGKTIDDAYNTMEFGSIIASDIVTISNNKYPAIRIAYTFSLLGENRCMWQYTIFDKTRIVALSVSGPDESYINKEEIQKTINSFTIKNYSSFEKKPIVTNNTNTSSSSTNKNTSSSSPSYNSNYNSFSSSNILLSILITLVAYMLVPLLIKLGNGGGFESKTANKIALWNSIIIGGAFFVFTSSQGIQWSIGPALLYYVINSAILTKKKDANNDSDIKIDKDIEQEEIISFFGEKYQEALYTVNHPSGIAPGMGNQNPIDKPEEEVKLDSKEIPWELQDENNNIVEDEVEDIQETQIPSQIEETKTTEDIIDNAHNTISEMKRIINDDTSTNNKEQNNIEIKSELERVEILEKYQKLLKDGLITEEEFNKIKDKLLNL